MKKVYIKQLLVLGILFLQLSQMEAQTISKGVVSAGGKTIQNKDLEFSYTIGEPITTLVGTSKIELNQGFQQVYANSIVTSTEENWNIGSVSTNVKLYPIPTSDFLNFQFSNPTGENCNFQVISSSGQLVSKGMIPKNSQLYTLEVSNLAHGIYQINWIDNNSTKLNTLKFIKN